MKLAPFIMKHLITIHGHFEPPNEDWWPDESDLETLKVCMERAIECAFQLPLPTGIKYTITEIDTEI